MRYKFVEQNCMPSSTLVSEQVHIRHNARFCDKIHINEESRMM